MFIYLSRANGTPGLQTTTLNDGEGEGRGWPHENECSFIYPEPVDMLGVFFVTKGMCGTRAGCIMSLVVLCDRCVHVCVCDCVCVRVCMCVCVS